MDISDAIENLDQAMHDLGYTQDNRVQVLATYLKSPGSRTESEF